ncbi:MAG TPA: DUF4190 domain-containing protein [Solirubrobacteraceae bacterium]|nr:DUF4190 domain-containing protein [Solirubrobacteraceae bacterium]
MNEPSSTRAARPDERRGPDDALHSRSATLALWLGILGVGLGFLLMFAVLTPAAIVYGARGLREISGDPRLQGRGRAWTGIGLAIIAPLLWVGVFVAFLTEGLV